MTKPVYHTPTHPTEPEPVPSAPVWRGDTMLGPEIPPRRWRNGTMHFTKVWRNGNWQLDKTWVPDVPGEDPAP